MRIITVNIKQTLPTVSKAMLILQGELSSARRLGVQVIKIVHGYGSTGNGGGIKKATHAFLMAAVKNGRIKGWCAGENFSSGTIDGQKLFRIYPELKKDSDYGRQNDGVSIVVLR